MKSDRGIAQISFEPKTRNLKNITLRINNLKFKCNRCATFCCKLGGPKVSSNDIERLKRADCCETRFLDSAQRSLKNKSDGSCAFLKFDTVEQIYECLVYTHRPTLCRLYPFYLEETRPNLSVLKIMPCRGINRRFGELIDKRFIINHIIDALDNSSTTS